MRHDEVRDLFASLLQDVCHDVEVEPHTQTLTGQISSSSTNSSDEARLDVSARGFWQRGQRAFFDVRVFNPFAKSHLNLKPHSLPSRMRKGGTIISASLRLSMASSAPSCLHPMAEVEGKLSAS